MTVIAFAHPVYAEKSQTPETAADDLGSSKGASSLSDMRTEAYLTLMGGDEFKEMPVTADEVREIKAILNAPDKSQPLHLRKDASRSRVFQIHQEKRLDDYRYVVFSCHGVIPEKINRIEQPALVLSQPDPVTKKKEYLTMTDVFGLKLNADLVTLSACNTGRGELIRGEGVRGLTRLFMYTETPAVSVTLWSVEANSAKKLSTGLYSNLKNGKPRAEALRQIKLDMIRDKEDELFRHPFFWAPVVIFGDAN